MHRLGVLGDLTRSKDLGRGEKSVVLVGAQVLIGVSCVVWCSNDLKVSLSFPPPPRSYPHLGSGHRGGTNWPGLLTSEPNFPSWPGEGGGRLTPQLSHAAAWQGGCAAPSREIRGDSRMSVGSRRGVGPAQEG